MFVCRVCREAEAMRLQVPRKELEEVTSLVHGDEPHRDDGQPWVVAPDAVARSRIRRGVRDLTSQRLWPTRFSCIAAGLLGSIDDGGGPTLTRLEITNGWRTVRRRIARVVDRWRRCTGCDAMEGSEVRGRDGGSDCCRVVEVRVMRWWSRKCRRREMGVGEWSEGLCGRRR